MVYRYTYIYHKNQPSVGKYTKNGSSGYEWKPNFEHTQIHNQKPGHIQIQKNVKW